MKRLRGMRPQDIAVLLKIVGLGKSQWKNTGLARQLFISQSEVSQALYRNWTAGLLDESKRGVHKKSLVEFLIHCIKYVSAQEPGAMVRGIPTAHAAPPLSRVNHSGNEVYAWPDEEGTIRGEMIEPLSPSVLKAAKADSVFYELLAPADAIRVGTSGEFKIAADELQKRIPMR